MEFLFTTLSLLAVTMVASFIYYRRIKQAQGEYESARDLIKNITLGFTNQISRLTKSIERTEEKAMKAQQSSEEAIELSRDAINIASEGLEETKSFSEKLSETGKAIDALKNEFQKLSTSHVIYAPKSDVEAPIPIQQEAILEQLTNTELQVLSIIEELGEGSVPDVIDIIKKTREHTARILKKLYDKGFIDRNTSRMPYRYYIRKEIKELIQQHKKRVKISV